MKHQAQQFDLTWDRPEDFRLVPETTLDGDRVKALALAKEQAEREQERKQERLFAGPKPENRAEESGNRIIFHAFYGDDTAWHGETYTYETLVAPYDPQAGHYWVASKGRTFVVRSVDGQGCLATLEDALNLLGYGSANGWQPDLYIVPRCKMNWETWQKKWSKRTERGNL